MKRFCTKILSLLLTGAVLLSTTSFAANMHFCCGKLVSVSMTGEAQHCSKTIQNSDGNASKCTLGQMDCCSNATYFHAGKNDLKKVAPELESTDFIFLSAFIFSYINLFEGLEQNVVPFNNYEPPRIQKDLLILHETFLI